MKTSKLKPKVLSILFSLYENDPSPKAYGEVSSVINNVPSATVDKVTSVVEHLIHSKLVDRTSRNDVALISINDAGIRWLDEHEEYERQKSLKNWLVKPVIVAAVVSIITTSIAIAIQSGTAKKLDPLPKTQTHTQA